MKKILPSLFASIFFGALLGGCSSVDTGQIASSIRDGAETYRSSEDQKDAKEAAEKAEKKARKEEAATNAAGSKYYGERPGVINIEGQSYVRRGTEKTGASGFWFGDQWYDRVGEQHEGALFVEGNASSGNGFWQNSKYWVPGSGSAQTVSSGSPRIINIQGQSYVSNGSVRTSGSGFAYNGLWYARSNDDLDGTEFREGNQSDGNGFWQNSKYWVPKN